MSEAEFAGWDAESVEMAAKQVGEEAGDSGAGHSGEKTGSVVGSPVTAAAMFSRFLRMMRLLPNSYLAPKGDNYRQKTGPRERGGRGKRISGLAGCGCGICGGGLDYSALQR